MSRPPQSFRKLSVLARKVFVRMLSSKTNDPEGFTDPTKRLCKIMLSYPKSGLEHALDESGIRVSPDTAERVLERFENAGMLAYRFFEWTRKQHPHRGCSHTVKSYHTVIAALAKIRQYRIMWDVVAAIRRDGLLNVETFCIVMRKYARAQKVDEAIYTFNVMDKYGVSPNLAAFNSLLGAFCKSRTCGRRRRCSTKCARGSSPTQRLTAYCSRGGGGLRICPRCGMFTGK
uniref:Pentatricopeptide repeat-containing protein n=1 Tax=Ananas comosus var. bracteatus TaxID=296719 RepID=A0A6V7Q8L2_ANACO|nr:unnamed protein product [Ananas comosus var. bracteatus]